MSQFTDTYRTIMPPKKTKAASTPSLRGCAIAFASNSVPADCLGGTSLANIKSSISNSSGSYVTKVDECTHLVVSKAQYDKSLTKVETAKALSTVHILSFEWLEKAINSQSPIGEVPYILHTRNQTGPESTANGTTKGTVKASRSTKKADDGDDADDIKPPPSKKRKRDSEDDTSGQAEPRATGGGKTMNVTKNLDLKIPLDEVLILQRGRNYTVHIGEDSTIYDVTLNQSDSGANANKFYRMQLLKDPHGIWWTWTRWGRVGEDGQSKMLGGGDYDLAMTEFEKKFKDKTGNKWEDRATGPIKPKKYAFIERSYEDSEDEEDLPGAENRKKMKKEEGAEEEEVVESKLPEPVQRLLKLIFNQEYFNNTFAS